MLLALVISMLIMSIWMRYFAPKPPEEQPTTQQTGELLDGQTPDEYAEYEPLEVTPESATEVIPSEELAKDQEVVVETDRLIATFGTFGGRLTSLKLPEYDSKTGGYVELVPQEEASPKPLKLRFHSPEFGAREEAFAYEHKLYEPTSTVLYNLATGLRSCAGNILPGAGEDETLHQIESCLPNAAGDQDLRTLVAAIGGNAISSGGADALSRQADRLAAGKTLVLSHQMTPQLRIIKAFVFLPGSYSFDMYTLFRNTSDAPLDLGRGRPSYSIHWAPGLASNETLAKYDALSAVSLVGKDFQQKGIGKYKDGKEFPGNLNWLGLKRKYFFVVLEPESGLMGASIKTWDKKQENIHISLDMKPMKLAPGAMTAGNVRLSAGPVMKEALEGIGPEFGRVLNFGFFDYFGKILMAGLLWFNKYVQNYGLAIILLTIVVRVGLFPLNQKSYKSMKEMQALQPKVQELREKLKNNPQEMNKKMMELYRTHKVNPMGGCLPMAFQMPVFIALFQALRNAIELRGAHFLWIADLSEADRLFTITSPIEFPINLLPLLVIGAMLIQQQMTPMAAGGQNEAQQKMMKYMPVIIGFLFYNMPAGLNVYFLISTVLGLVQQYFVQKAS